MNYSIHSFDVVTSTNDVAAQMVREGAPEGTVIVARGQTAGRGRRGRSWTSPIGEGLYLSVILRPPIPLTDVWQIGFMASVAVAEAVERTAGVRPRIKWPNDILLRGRKVAGILIELPVVSPGGVHREQNAAPQLTGRPVVLGIGVNVNTKDFPSELQRSATSIALTRGQTVAIPDVESALLLFLDSWYSKYLEQGFEPVLNVWKHLDCTVGRKTRIDVDGQIIEGIVEQVGSVHGDIVVRCNDGTAVTISAGNTLLDDCFPD